MAKDDSVIWLFKEKEPAAINFNPSYLSASIEPNVFLKKKRCKILKSLFVVIICTWRRVYMPQSPCGGQRTTSCGFQGFGSGCQA